MTPILKILTEYCDVLVDDDRMTELKQTDFPLWAFKMYGYFRAGLSLLTLPSELLPFLIGDNGEKLTLPLFGTTTVAVPYGESGEYTVSTEFIGYEYISARTVSRDKYGDVYYVPLTSAYNPETGEITIDVGTVPEDGLTVDIDLYKDGEFSENVSLEIMGIMAKAFQVVWETRFINNWLSNVPKIEDSSFYEQNRANKENADTERYAELKSTLDHALRRLDENNAYRKVVLGKRTGF